MTEQVATEINVQVTWPELPCLMWDLQYKEMVRVLGVTELGRNFIIEDHGHLYEVPLAQLTRNAPKDAPEPSEFTSQYLQDADSAGI